MPCENPTDRPPTPGISRLTDFGVIVPLKPEHVHWARGTYASVRYFMEDTPVCFLVDADRRHVPSDLVDADGAYVVCRDDIEPDEAWELSFGSLKAKNIALWHSPFETFMLVDADAVVWGDMRVHADFERFDFVVDSAIVDPQSVRRSVMDVGADVLSQHLDARRHAEAYVNTGVYFGRRGMLDLVEYRALLRLGREHPGLFYGDQGSFNALLFGAVQSGRLRLDQRQLQVQSGKTAPQELRRRFGFVDGRPSVVGEPVVLHWVGSPKPRVREGHDDYFEPMTFFRKRFATRARGGLPGPRDTFRLRLEDAACTDFRGTNLRGRWSGLARHTRFRYRALKVRARRRTPDRIVRMLRGSSRRGR